jgi:hypothetical protein
MIARAKILFFRANFRLRRHTISLAQRITQALEAVSECARLKANRRSNA